MVNKIITPRAAKLPDVPAPTLAAIRAARVALGDAVRTTPVWEHQPNLWFKLECWQYAGTFKPRGALISMQALTDAERAKGVVAVSAGNHAVAVSYAAKRMGVAATVLMPKTASPIRMTQCRDYGAEVVLTDDMQSLFDTVELIQTQQKNVLIHPFEGPNVALGTATLGLELCEQIADLDAVVVAIGGGGLAGGMASAIRQLQPQCEIYGVEPAGANSMALSFQAGEPVTLSTLDSIADSLSAPYAMPYSYSLCQQFLSGIVTVTDQQIRDAMAWFFIHMKLAVEPAAAAALAGLHGPLQQVLAGKRVAVIVCGTNIDIPGYCQHVTE